jgi:hypothetical protein
VLCGTALVQVGELAHLSVAGIKTILIVPTGRAENSDEVSLHVNVAERYGFGNRVRGTIQLVTDADDATATHVELLFRDQHLTRADMWQLMGCLTRTVIYRGQTVNPLGTGSAEVIHIYHKGQEVDSAYVSHPQTKPIFRSGSARFTLLIEVSKEMLENWSNGELMHERLVNGFLDELFGRWQHFKVKHQISIVLFGRTVKDPKDPLRSESAEDSSSDFYHVLISETSSDSWREIARKLRRAFHRDSFPQSLSLAAESNMLEAINLAAMDFSDERTDTHLGSTGTSIIAVTAGAGLFETKHAILKNTTELLIGNSVGVDIVALSPKPTHPVPLFKYSNQGVDEYALPHWVDISFWKGPNDLSTSSWEADDFYRPSNRIALPLLQQVMGRDAPSDAMENHDDQIFQKEAPVIVLQNPIRHMASNQVVSSSLDTVKDEKFAPITPRHLKTPGRIRQSSISTRSRSSSNVSSPSQLIKDPLIRAMREKVPLRPLLSTNRKISVGPRGLAVSRGAASTVLSTDHVQHEKEASTISQPVSIEPSGIAKQIRATLARKPSSMSLASHKLSDPDHSTTSRPIDIVVNQETSSTESLDAASEFRKGMAKTTLEATMEDGSSPATTLKAATLLGSDRDSVSEALDMLSPWVVLLNPCNPRRDNMRVASQYRKWQHIFPREISSGAFKWSSMCLPGALPLTAEYCPSSAELDSHYEKAFRRHIVSDDGARNLLERLIDARLIHGFQIVSITNSGSDRTFQSQDRPILLVLGRVYHELQRLSDVEIQVVEYEPRTPVGGLGFEVEREQAVYRPVIRLPSGLVCKPTIVPRSSLPSDDWALLDGHVLGSSQLTLTSATSKIRLVLIPADLPRHEYGASNTTRELSEDERRIEGIQRLTQIWQRQRHFSDEDRQHQVSLARMDNKALGDRDPNPLAIEYHTRDPSAVVNAYGPILSSHIEEGEVLTPLFAESERHHSSNFDVTKLVKQMQEEPPYGVEMRDRRWLAVNHVKCFRGDEMTTWLLGVFKDLKDREEAVAVGNELMKREIFAHVRQKHDFRDGHYFYQITSAFRTTDYPDTRSVFSKAAWRSIPSTPGIESITSPFIRPVSVDPGAQAKLTPQLGTGDRKDLLLSQVLQYNVDPNHKSEHAQIIDLHYDRIHNPDNCYHIQLEWLGASTKFVQVAVTRWASLVEGYGLKLAQLPLEEASKCHLNHPFDQPQHIRLAVRPPERGLATPLLEPQSIGSRTIESHNAYYKAILRQNDFVLDLEAASAFSTKLPLRYSWGPLRYVHTQFIHRSSLVLAQIYVPHEDSENQSIDESDNNAVSILVLPNLTATRKSGIANTTTNTPAGISNTPSESAEEIIRRLREFCADEKALRAVYQEASERRRRPLQSSPSMNTVLATDLDIPPMSLPPHLTHRTGLRYIG